MFTLKLNDYQLLANVFEEQILCTQEIPVGPTVSPSVWQSFDTCKSF